MKKTLMATLAVPAAVVVLGIVGAGPIGAQTTIPQQEVAVLTVTKTVVGTAPTGTEFTLHLTCTGRIVDGKPATNVTDYDEDMTFGATGGSKDFEFTDQSDCVVTETDDGGADSSTGPVDVAIDQPVDYAAEITNTFDPAITTTTAAAAAAAVAATAAFTG